MNYVNREHLNTYLRGIKYLGQGHQGVCYLNERKKVVYKIFHSYFDNEEEYYKEEDLLKFSNIENKTFIWPSDVIKVNTELVGYTLPYKKAKNLYQINPLQINLNSLKRALTNAYKDIELLSDNQVRIYDAVYNTLYSQGRIYVIDTLEYGELQTTYIQNRSNIDYEIKLFLIDNYFNHLVDSSPILKEMYKDKEVSSIIFLEELKKELSSLLGEELQTLSKAKKYIKRIENPVYERGIE